MHRSPRIRSCTPTARDANRDLRPSPRQAFESTKFRVDICRCLEKVSRLQRLLLDTVSHAKVAPTILLLFRSPCCIADRNGAATRRVRSAEARTHLQDRLFLGQVNSEGRCSQRCAPGGLAITWLFIAASYHNELQTQRSDCNNDLAPICNPTRVKPTG